MTGTMEKTPVPNEYLSAFVGRVREMNDDALLRTRRRMAVAAGQYEPDAIAAVKAEVARRGLTSAQQREAAVRAARDTLDSLQEDAVGLAVQGHSEDQIRGQLQARGLDESAAAAIARRAWDLPPEQLHGAGRRNMVAGAAVCLAGLALTAGSCLFLATSEGGGPWVIAWGMVLVGILQFVRGARQADRAGRIELPVETCVEWTQEDHVRSVTFDTSGFGVTRRAPGRTEWRDLQEDTLVAAVEANSHDDPSGTLDIAALRARHRSDVAARGGGIVSVDRVRAGGVGAVRAVSKFADGLAYIYEGSLIVPLRNARLTVALRARERGITGVREAVTVGHWFETGLLHVAVGPPTGRPTRVEGLLLDPYDQAYDAVALCALYDDERLDEFFPGHPVSKVRRWLATVAGTLRIDDAVRPDPAGISTPAEPPRLTFPQLPTSSIGLLFLRAGNMQAAERLFAEAVPLENDEPAVQNETTAKDLVFLGLAREMQGKFVEAEWAMTRAERIFQATVGEQDIRTVRATSHRARICLSLERFGEAGALFEQVLPALDARGSRGDVAVALNGLGLVRTAAGRHVEAIALFERALIRFEEAEKEQKQRISDRATVMENLANALDVVGDHRKAEAARAAAKAVIAEITTERLQSLKPSR